MDIFERLPHDLKALIIGQVPQGRAVCSDSRHVYVQRVKRLSVRENSMWSQSESQECLDIGQYVNVKYLCIARWDVGKIDLSKLFQFVTLHILSCHRLYELLMPSYNDKLVQITMPSVPYLSSLNVKAFPNLRVLEYCESTMESLDLSANQNLVSVHIGNSRLLKEIIFNDQVSYQKLKTFDISYCITLTRLDLKSCPSLKELICTNCVELKTIDVSKCQELCVFEGSDCHELVLYDDAFSNTKRLTKINCQNVEYVFSLDTSLQNLHYLRKLRIDSTNIETLDLTKCPYLVELDCSGTNIQELDVSHNKRLRKLWCGACELTHLNLQNNKKLEFMDCAYNSNLDSIIFPSQSAIRQLYCNHTSVSDIAWESIPLLDELYVANTNIDFICTACLAKITYIDCSNTPVDFLDLYVCKNLQTLICKNTFITDIDTSTNTNLRYLNCSVSEIVSLNLSNNPCIVELQVQLSNISKLDITALPLLRFLDATGTLIHDLDISQNIDMRICKCAPYVKVKTGTLAQEECVVYEK